MFDLFHATEKSGISPEKSGGHVPEFSVSLKGKGKSGSTGLSLSGRPEKSDGLPFTPRGIKRWTKSDLRDEANHLLFEIEKAEAAREAAEVEQSPFRDAFNAASTTLIGMHSARKQGRLIAKPVMLKAYDVRVAAGHAWNAPRAKMKDAERWLKALRSELTNINMELE